ncbi:glycosyltransferase [Flavobacterium sp.]|uniref:glycosyltransferase n=1 Tax=Flavobacterium sp. TaxID=239 RepID=UPI00286AB73A|nr:glycosyltransferase [Flavobacterium sp.]
MTFLIITHVPHILEEKQYFAYAPYVREMNIWIKNTDKVIIVAPLIQAKKTAIDIRYEHSNIEFVPIESFDVLGVKAVFQTLYKTPKISWTIFKAMQKADHIHVRCPGNIGLLGCFVQILFPNKIKTAKYASNWDSNSVQPWSYRLQRWILNNTFLTRNMQVLVYGDWNNASKNIKSFFTATYHENEKQPINIRNTNQTPIKFVFVGTLTKGKNPYYGIKIVKALNKTGIKSTIDLYGDGILYDEIATVIRENNLQESVFLKGNANKESLIEVYKNSHFLVLQSGSFEGWPKVVAESMFWGCVPLAIPTSVVPQMLDNGTRGLLLTGNLEVDISNIITMIKDNMVYQQMATAACDWSRKYTLDVFEQEIEKLMNTL